MAYAKTNTGNETAGEVRMIPLDAIGLVEGLNPRTDAGGEGLEELVASVRSCGVLQAILVKPAKDGDTDFTLIAGQRRLLAAKRAGLKEVPAVVREVDGRAREFALVENVKRAALNPIDEARAYEALVREGGLRQKQVAGKVQVSPQLVGERMRLLTLPEAVQGHLAAGAIPPACGKDLAKIADVSKLLAIAVGEALATGAIEAAHFTADPGPSVAWVARERAAQGEWVGMRVDGYTALLIDELPLGEEVRAELKAKVAELGAEAAQWTRLVFDGTDIDRARAYGCLLELGRDWPHQFVCDATFVADRARAKVEELADAHKRAERGRREQNEAGTAAGPKDTAARDARRQEHSARQEAKDAAHAANVQFGARLGKRYRAVKLDKDVARLCVLLAIERDLDAIAARGMRLTHADWQTVERKTTKAGKVRRKIAYLERAEAGRRLYEWIVAAKTPEEILGRFVQAVVAATYSDEEAVAQSRRVAWEPPHEGFHDDEAHKAAREVRRVLRKLAKPALVAELRPATVDEREGR